MNEKIHIGISTCLLGEKVRYDAGHKRDPYILNTLGLYFNFYPVCPEAEAGLGIPRESMRLVGDAQAPRLVTQKTQTDMTDRMQQWIHGRIDDLEQEELRGFIFKSGSPSSGMERVRVYNSGGSATKTGVGLFAKAFMDRFPSIPVEEEGRLHDIDLRENFIVRVFAYDRWRKLKDAGLSSKALIEFHASHKYLLMAHSPAMLKELGQLTARHKDLSLDEFEAQYEALFMKALKEAATVKKNTNVLMHMAGYFKKVLGKAEKEELFEILEQYQNEYIPLIVPVTLIRHYVKIYGEAYLEGQYYLEPHPLELKLRNHA